MLNKRRWLINIVMVIAAFSFAGVAVILPFTAAFQDDSPATTPTSTEASPASQQSELEAQARGYELVLQREPDNQTALKGLLDVRIQMRDVEGAIAPLEKLAELNPEQTEFTILLAQARQQLGDREGAAQAYRGVLSAHPGDLYALQGLVSLLLEQDRPEAAVGLLQDTLQSADELNQVQSDAVDVTSVRLLLGQVYANEERYEEAIAVYDQAIQGASQDFRPLFAKALVLQAQGKDEEAAPLFTTAASLAPPEFKDQIEQIAAGETPATSPTDGGVPAIEESPEAAPEESPAEAE